MNPSKKKARNFVEYYNLRISERVVFFFQTKLRTLQLVSLSELNQD